MKDFVYNQINDHEATFDNDNIRDFVDFYWRTVKHYKEDERTYITSKPQLDFFFNWNVVLIEINEKQNTDTIRK